MGTICLPVPQPTHLAGIARVRAYSGDCDKRGKLYQNPMSGGVLLAVRIPLFPRVHVQNLTQKFSPASIRLDQNTKAIFSSVSSV